MAGNYLDNRIYKLNDLSKLDLNYLIIDCLKIQKHPTHFNLKDALNVHKKLKPGKTILTNLHSDMDYYLLLRKLPKNVLPAYDGMSVVL